MTRAIALGFRHGGGLVSSSLAAVPGAVAAAVPSVLGFREGFFPDTRVMS